jgi:adenylate cyclase
MSKPQTAEEYWQNLLTGRRSPARTERAFFRMFPHDPRCKLCNVPFAGAGGAVMRALGRRPSKRNPRYCNTCERYIEKYRGGTEVEMTLLFADVRGSTTAGETMSPLQFTQLMNRFYATATRVLINADAWIDKLVGDEVIGFFFPYVGEHARAAVQAARELLFATGHGRTEGPWLPVGAGVHTGVAYVGVVGSRETVSDVTALGDAVNVTARLASLARAGEILVSDATYAAAGLAEEAHEHRQEDLKGRAEPVGVHVLRAGARASGAQHAGA